MLKINIDTSKLNNQKRVDRANKAASILLNILNSDKFKKLVTEMQPHWRQGETSYLNNMPNEYIYNLIMSGKEEWNNEIDNEIDLIIDDYYKRWSRVVGYMNPSKPTIYVNTKYFDSMTMTKVVSNMLHEYMHTLGSRHSGKYFRMSIPYYMNYIVESHFKDYFDKPQNREYKVICKRVWWKLWIGKNCYRVYK